MALIKCPECGKDFPDTAKACPSCGCVNKHNHKISIKKIFYVLLAIIIISGIIITVYFNINGTKFGSMPIGISKDAYQAGLDTVQIVDDYLGTGIKQGEAVKELDDLYFSFVYDEKDINHKNLIIKSQISSLGQKIGNQFTSAFVGTYIFEQQVQKNIAEIQELRDDLAEILEIKAKYK